MDARSFFSNRPLSWRRHGQHWRLHSELPLPPAPRVLRPQGLPQAPCTLPLMLRGSMASNIREQRGWGQRERACDLDTLLWLRWPISVLLELETSLCPGLLSLYYKLWTSKGRFVEIWDVLNLKSSSCSLNLFTWFLFQVKGNSSWWNSGISVSPGGLVSTPTVPRLYPASFVLEEAAWGVQKQTLT